MLVHWVKNNLYKKSACAYFYNLSKCPIIYNILKKSTKTTPYVMFCEEGDLSALTQNDQIRRHIRCIFYREYGISEWGSDTTYCYAWTLMSDMIKNMTLIKKNGIFTLQCLHFKTLLTTALSTDFHRWVVSFTDIIALFFVHSDSIFSHYSPPLNVWWHTG